jgi:ribosomal protein S8
MRIKNNKNAKKKKQKHLHYSKLDNAKLDVLTVLYYIQLFHSTFKTNFGIMGILGGRTRKT